MRTQIQASVEKTLKATINIRAPSTLRANIGAGVSGIISDHSKLNNLDYESSGHKGFASQKELQNYAKQTELPGTLSNLEIENILK